MTRHRRDEPEQESVLTELVAGWSAWQMTGEDRPTSEDLRRTDGHTE